MEYGKEIDKAQFDKWIKTLRSGKYNQTKDVLQNEDGYCCLGVACRLFVENPYMRNGILKGEFPVDQHQAPQWLKDINSDFGFKIKSELSELNDEMDFSFDEIADLLEAVYIHQVLK